MAQSGGGLWHGHSQNLPRDRVRLRTAADIPVSPGLPKLNILSELQIHKRFLRLFHKRSLIFNRVIYERQFAALLQLATDRKLPPCCEVLVAAGVGAVDSWVEREPAGRRPLRSPDRKAGEAGGDRKARLQEALEELRKAPALNPSQRAAVEAAVRRTCTIIQGPPGTSRSRCCSSGPRLRCWACARSSRPPTATSPWTTSPRASTRQDATCSVHNPARRHRSVSERRRRGRLPEDGRDAGRGAHLRGQVGAPRAEGLPHRRHVGAAAVWTKNKKKTYVQCLGGYWGAWVWGCCGSHLFQVVACHMMSEVVAHVFRTEPARLGLPSSRSLFQKAVASRRDSPHPLALPSPSPSPVPRVSPPGLRSSGGRRRAPRGVRPTRHCAPDGGTGSTQRISPHGLSSAYRTRVGFACITYHRMCLTYVSNFACSALHCIHCLSRHHMSLTVCTHRCTQGLRN